MTGALDFSAVIPDVVTVEVTVFAGSRGRGITRTDKLSQAERSMALLAGALPSSVVCSVKDGPPGEGESIVVHTHSDYGIRARTFTGPHRVQQTLAHALDALETT